MGHYDDIIEKIEDREAEEVFQKTGLYPHEIDRMNYLEKQVREYDEFMRIEPKREELVLLRAKKLQFKGKEQQ